MNRFFLIFIIVVSYGFSSSNDRCYVFNKINNGRKIEDDNDYNRFEKVANNDSNKELSLIPNVYASLAKYNLQQGNYSKASEYFYKVLRMIDNKDSNIHSSLFPIILVDKVSKVFDESLMQTLISNTYKDLNSVNRSYSTQELAEDLIDLTKGTSVEITNEKINCYFSTLTAIENFVDLSKYTPKEVEAFESFSNDIPNKLLKIKAGFMLADYYINAGIKEHLGGALSLEEKEIALILIKPEISKAADYISDFMIEYMDYESINKYIKPIEGKDIKFGDFLKNNGASVVIKDIEQAITMYYFPAPNKDQAFPLPEFSKSEKLENTKNLQEQKGRFEGETFRSKRKASKRNSSIIRRRKIYQTERLKAFREAIRK